MISTPRAGRSGRWVWAGLGLAVGLQTALAQTPDLAALRKTALTNSDDKDQVQAWVQAQVTGLFESADPLRDGSALYRTLRTHFRASDANAGFKDQVSQMLASAFTAQYKPPADGKKNENPLPAVFVLVALKLHPQPGGLACYRAALGDPASGIRLVAADGLLTAAVPADQWKTLFEQVAKLAAAESNPAALSRQWRVLIRDGAAPADQVAKALLDILDARALRFEQQGVMPSVVDVNIIAWLLGQDQPLKNATTKKRLVLLTGRVLADAVHAYLNQGPDKLRRHRLERVILSTETALKQLAKGAGDGDLPDVTGAMCGGGETCRVNMASALAGWIGTTDRAGVLNGEPFKLEPGLGIERPAEKEENGAASPGG